MNIKKGLVMELQESDAYIMTSSGEFVKLKIDKKKTLPNLGGEYSSRIFENPFMCISKFKYAVAACLLFFMVSFGGGTYAYYTPTSTITININPSIEFKLNRWSRVLSSKPLNSDGEKILLEIKPKNKLAEDALIMVINQAKQDKYINDNYSNMDKTITINIVGKGVNLSSLEKELSKSNINMKIDSNGNNIYNKNNRKLDNLLPKNNSDKNINVSTNGNSSVSSVSTSDDSSVSSVSTSDDSSVSKSAIDKNNSNININNKDNKVLGNTGNSSNNSNDKYNNSLENDNKKDNNNANLEKSDGKLRKDKTDGHYESNKEDKNNKK